MKTQKYFLCARTRGLFLGLAVFLMALTKNAHALSMYADTQITPENAQTQQAIITIKASDARWNGFVVDETSAANRTPVIPFAIPTNNGVFFRVVITPTDNALPLLPPMGVLSFSRDDMMVASIPVLGRKLAPNSKEVAPSDVDKSTAFEFNVSPDLFLVAKFEIYCFEVSAGPRISSPVLQARYWFYVSNFFPEEIKVN
jgi:hypothetical protein